MFINCPVCGHGCQYLNEGCHAKYMELTCRTFRCHTCADGTVDTQPCKDFKTLGNHVICRCDWDGVQCKGCCKFGPDVRYIIAYRDIRFSTRRMIHTYERDCVVDFTETEYSNCELQTQVCATCDRGVLMGHTGAICLKCWRDEIQQDWCHGRMDNCRHVIENSAIGRELRACSTCLIRRDCHTCIQPFVYVKNTWYLNRFRCDACKPPCKLECNKCGHVYNWGSVFAPERSMWFCTLCDRQGFDLHTLFARVEFVTFGSMACAIIPHVMNVPRALVICAATIETTNRAKPGYLEQLMVRNLQENNSPLDDESAIACLVLMRYYRLPNDIRLKIIAMAQQSDA